MVSKYKYLGAIYALSTAIFYMFLRPYAELSAGEKPPKAYFTKVTRVIDGDTVEIEGGEKVRYIGIDTPELHHPNKPVQPFAEKAWRYNQSLVEWSVKREIREKIHGARKPMNRREL